MAITENIRKINYKTQMSFFVFFLLSFLVCLIISVINIKLLPEEFHTQFYGDYIKNNSIFLFFKYFFIISLIYFSFCYSLIIGNENLATRTGKKVLFSDIVSRGLYILVFLTVIFFLGQEFIVPSMGSKIETIQNNTLRAKNLLDKGNAYYTNGDVTGSLLCYEEYIKIIDDDNIKERLRELRLKKSKMNYDSLKKENNKIISEDTTIAKSITDYYELAEIYFQKQDYLSSLYYFQYVANGNSSKKNDAAEKIGKVRKILRFRNSMMTDAQFNEFMNSEDLKIKSIYSQKKLAEKYYLEKDYQKALFVYNDILKINDSLRDTIQAQNETYAKLSSVSVELSDTSNKKIFSGKSNLTFMFAKDVMINIGYIVKVLDMDKLENTFYFYDVKFYKFGSDFKIIDTVSAPYGKALSKTDFTLYCYSFQDRNIEYFPVPQLIENSIFENNIIDKLGSEEKKYLLNFYKKENSLFKLDENVSPEIKMNIGKIINKTNFNLKELLFDKDFERFDNIYTTPVDIDIIYNFSYNYNKALNFSLIKLFQLKDIGVKKENKTKFSVGFNDNFIKTAITDKISRIFLFFSFTLIIISISWKLRANYKAGIPVYHYPLLLLIPLFLYFLLELLQIFVTSFYSVLAFTYDFSVVLILCFVINSIIALGSIIFTASNRT